MGTLFGIGGTVTEAANDVVGGVMEFRAPQLPSRISSSSSEDLSFYDSKGRRLGRWGKGSGHLLSIESHAWNMK